jgi:aspartyl-tRNA(Asn)/glutamyl-tRNA(Gln) amidotransferase subunit A
VSGGDGGSALAIVDAIRSRRASAHDVAAAALDRIALRDRTLNCFTRVLGDRAFRDADRVDRLVATGEDPGPLAGVPFAVKNLFDVAGVTTLAGSRIHADHPPAPRDAAAVAALRRAGAVLVGCLNMDEYAFGFTTENSHYGPTRNPHDLSRIAGGSSGGSAAAVAAGLVPLSLGSDTNGSIRVPAALCGVFGLKPTYGRVSRAGVVLFAGSFDHVGPFARSVRDLALAFDALQGPDPADPICDGRPAEPTMPELDRGIAGLRIAVAGGHFAQFAEPAALAAVERVARALGASRRVTIAEVSRARAAAAVITSSEGAAYHLEDLKRRAKDFDPLTRDRFRAGALIPAALYLQAQRFRVWFRERVREVFRDVDVVVAPTTPYPAPPIGAPRTTTVDGVEVVTRGHLGAFTQPWSFIGLPAISMPIAGVAGAGPLPLGVQLIAAPFREAHLFRAAARLEADGVVAAPVAPARG